MKFFLLLFVQSILVLLNLTKKKEYLWEYLNVEWSVANVKFFNIWLCGLPYLNQNADFLLNESYQEVIAKG